MLAVFTLRLAERRLEDAHAFMVWHQGEDEQRAPRFARAALKLLFCVRLFASQVLPLVR